MGRINVTSRIFAEPLGSNIQTYGVVLILIEQGWQNVREDREVSEEGERTWMQQRGTFIELDKDEEHTEKTEQTLWLVLGEDPAARSHRVEQFTAL